MDKKIMKITFEGQTHQIDANTLINVLLHYQNVVNEANRELSGGAKNIELKINALEKGSFVIDVSVVESAIKHLFSGESVAYLASLYAVVDGTHKLYKWFKGKPVKTEQDKEKAKTIIGNTEFNVTINVYNQPPVREAVSKSIETADADINVEGISIDCGEKEPTVFKKEDFKDYIYTDFDEENIIPNEQEEIVDAVLTIIALNFEPGSRWQFIYNGFKIPMIVKDDALMKKINEGERFGKGDAIRVKMKIVKRYNPTYKAYENKSYKIVEFMEHIEAPKQPDLF